MKNYKTVFCFILLILIGCISNTEPNKPISGPHPAPLEILLSQNKLLGTELTKLPELQDGVSESEIETLNRLLLIYRENKDNFDSVFEKMYETGLPGVRKYCTPLQALFWLVQKNQFHEFDSLLQNYSLNRLFNLAWEFNVSDTLLDDEQIETIIRGTKNKQIKKGYITTYSTAGAKKVSKHILYDFERKPSWFSSKAKRVLKSAIKGKNKNWDDFDTVIDRLNSPEIISYYGIRQLGYVNWNTILGYREDHPVRSYAYHVFRTKTGDCVYISGFTIHCLQKAGFKSHFWRWPTPGGTYPWHMVAVYYDDGKKMIIDNGRPNPHKTGIVPFETFSSKR